MKKHTCQKKYIVLVLMPLLFLMELNHLFAQETGFTYQGLLTENGAPANGIYDLRFRLFDALVNGDQVANTITRTPVTVKDGLCNATLDFGGVFDGKNRWLEIGIRASGSTEAYTPLTPRQALLPGPYALHAAFAGGLSGDPTVTGTMTFNPASGAPFLVGNASKVEKLNADLLDGLDSTAFAPALHPPHDCPEGCYWRLRGNSGTSAGVNFLGTLDDEPLELKVNGQRALRLEPKADTVNVIGGFNGNAALSDGGYSSRGVTIAGGGKTGVPNLVRHGAPFADFATISGGAGNIIGGQPYSSIGGGYSNSISFMGQGYSIIGGGRFNEIADSFAVIGGGEGNLLGGACWWTTIGGGQSNVVGGMGGTIAGGVKNAIYGGCDLGPATPNSTIAGGFENVINAGANAGTIAGGQHNLLGVSFVPNSGGTIGGGEGNVVGASFGTIPGGQRNVATNFAFAAGRRAKAYHRGSFVWGDSTDADVASTSVDQLTGRAAGGVRFFSNSGATVGVQVAPGANAWSAMSDRNVKENFQSLDCREVLDRLEEIPVTTWNLKSQPASIRHIGPMAQDFKAAFGVGEDDRYISTSDADGVAFAAIKGLHSLLKEKDARIAALEKKAAQLEGLESSVTELQALVKSLAQTPAGGAQ